MDKEIKTEVRKDKGFVKVWCENGHYITNWNKQNIEDYTDAKIMYCPIGFDISTYYCVSDEEHTRYLEEQEAKAREEENNKQ